MLRSRAKVLVKKACQFLIQCTQKYSLREAMERTYKQAKMVKNLNVINSKMPKYRYVNQRLDQCLSQSKSLSHRFFWET